MTKDRMFVLLNQARRLSNGDLQQKQLSNLILMKIKDKLTEIFDGKPLANLNDQAKEYVVVDALLPVGWRRYF